MHELSIALSLVEIATEEIERRRLGSVEALHLRLGALSGVAEDALCFSWSAATAGTKLASARLIVETVPVTVRCAACEADRPLPSIQRSCCPICGGAAEVVGGREIELRALEVRDDVREHDDPDAVGG